MYGPNQMMFGFPRIYQDIHDVRMKDAIVTSTNSSVYYMNADAPIVHFNNSSSMNVYLPNGANHRVYWIDKIGGAGDVNICPAIGPAIAILSFTGQGCMVHYDGTTWRVVLPVYPVRPRIVLEDQKAASTNGGTFTNGAWRTRDLNTEVMDTHSLVSLSGNQFTLAAGTYSIRASAAALMVGGHQIRLRNVTDGTTILNGTQEYAYNGATGDFNQSRSLIDDTFTVGASKALEIQHQGQFTVATNGFGAHSGGWESVNIYTRVVLERVA